MAEEKEEVKEKKAAPAMDVKVTEGRILAALSYIWIVGVIILLFVKRENNYVIFHAKQAATLALGICIAFCIPIIGWWIITPILSLVMLLGLIMAAMGKRFEIPLVKEIVAKMTI